ncbi:MAG TPA: protein kinase [Stackebrandtia sp.]|jgi:serine/threonine-protein kinase|uniref:serine/threonine-protein kinase n=1 Tax=Stackebrandtia sp. TaxID=2023065 RepID=UPI002D5D3C97|nr:protein kinase [Stackebrandtia sp.]HZE39042.1 protein kinase [Stackebrandtia sp.]
MQPGSRLAERYRIDRHVGAGENGTVWFGHDTLLDRQVTIKVLDHSLAADDAVRARFRRTALDVASLVGPGIVDLYDLVEEYEDGVPVVCAIAARPAGTPLRRILDSCGTLPATETLSILASAASALHTAHEAGVLHLNLKPENLMVADGGDVTIVDFGFSHRYTDTSRNSNAMVAALYAAPELFDADPGVPASDIYSLGAIGYECLSGSVPFDGETAADIAQGHRRRSPAPLPDAAGPAETVVMKALSKRPSERFTFASSMVAVCLSVGEAHGIVVPPMLREVVGDFAESSVTAADLADDVAEHSPVPPEEPAPEPVAAEAIAEDATVEQPVVEGPSDDEPAAEDKPLVMAAAAVDVPEPARPAKPVKPPKPARRGRRRGVAVLIATIVLAVSGATLAYVVNPGQAATNAHDGGPSTAAGSSESSSDSSEESHSLAEINDPKSITRPPSTSKPPDHSSSSSPDTVGVPNVVGMAETDATAQLRAVGFVVEVSSNGHGKTECDVYAQDPLGDTRAPYGSTVTISVRFVENPVQCNGL